MDPKSHWEKVYVTRPPDAVSWYQEHATESMALIRRTGVPKTASIIDVGGGASTLVDDLLAEGYTNLTVLDLSAAALAAARERVGADAPVRWVEADITTAALQPGAYDVWHDRAVFHFLTGEDARRAYVQAVLRAVRPGGHVIVATFAEDGPSRCSGLPVVRYTAAQLHDEFGARFQLVDHHKHGHTTPSGTLQQFVYCYCLRLAS